MKIKHFITSVFCLGITFNSIAQINTTLWNLSSNKVVNIQTEELELPQNFSIYQIQPVLLQNLLQKAPKRGENAASMVIVSFPVGNGTTESFSIFEASVFHPLLAAKYPTIKSYIGKSTSSSKIIRFSFSSQKGLSATIISANRC